MNHLKPSPTLFQKSLAWGVHVFTSLGLIAGFMALLAIRENDWRTAMLWLFVCQLIDGADGSLARFFKVREVLPHINGKTIDTVIDFSTYALIPAFFFYEAPLVVGPWKMICTVIILIVSVLYYGKEGMVSEDGYFVGYPVLWNMVVFFLVFVVVAPEWGNVAIVLAFAALHFIPVKFAYPSRIKGLRSVTLWVTVVFLLAMVFIVYFYPTRVPLLNWTIIFGGIFYRLAAIHITWVKKG